MASVLSQPQPNPLQLSQAAASEEPLQARFYPYDYNGG